MRSPSPGHTTASRPIAVPPATDTPEARLAALEAQRGVDHQFMADLAAAPAHVRAGVAQQKSGLQSLTQSGMTMRQEVFAARSELASGIAGANDAAQSAAMAQMSVAVEAKFAALDAPRTG